MTVEPKRWRDDPELLEEMGLDLSAEAETLATHDLAAMEKAVQAKIAAGASTSAVVPYLIGALIVGGATAWWWASPSAQPEAARPVVAQGAAVSATRENAMPSAVAAEDADSADPENAVVRTELGGGPHEPVNAPARSATAAGSATRGNAAGSATRENAAGSATRENAAGSATPENTATAEAAAPSDLAAQLDAYERAQRLLTTGDASAAIEAFTAYLDAYPTGRLRTEAQLGRLHALFDAERFADAARAADVLARDDLAEHRRRDVHRVLGEARAMLGQCADADAALARSGAPEEERGQIIARCKTLAGSRAD